MSDSPLTSASLHRTSFTSTYRPSVATTDIAVEAPETISEISNGAVRHPSRLIAIADRFSANANSPTRGDGLALKPAYAAPPPPPSAANTTDRWPVVDELRMMTGDVKKQSVEGKALAAKRMGEFYGDLIRTRNDLFAAITSGSGRTYLRRDKALAAYALLYLKWSSQPLGEVTTMFNEEEWKKRTGSWTAIDQSLKDRKSENSDGTPLPNADTDAKDAATPEKTNIEFRTVNGKKLAFINCDTAFDRIWKTLSRPYNKKGEIFPTMKHVLQLMYYVDQQSGKVPTPFVDKDARYENLPDNITAYKNGTWGVTPERYRTLFAKLNNAAKNGISWGLRDRDRTVDLSAAQWAAIDRSIDTNTSPWNDRHAAMVTAARNAMSYYDQLFEVLTKVVRSYSEADKKAASL